MPLSAVAVARCRTTRHDDFASCRCRLIAAPGGSVNSMVDAQRGQQHRTITLDDLRRARHAGLRGTGRARLHVFGPLQRGGDLRSLAGRLLGIGAGHARLGAATLRGGHGSRQFRCGNAAQGRALLRRQLRAMPMVRPARRRWRSRWACCPLARAWCRPRANGPSSAFTGSPAMAFAPRPCRRGSSAWPTRISGLSRLSLIASCRRSRSSSIASESPTRGGQQCAVPAERNTGHRARFPRGSLHPRSAHAASAA